MATFRSVTSAISNPAVLSLGVDKPAGMAAGDLLVAAVAVRSFTSTPTTPAGWSLLRSDLSWFSTSGLRQSIFTRVADGTETATLTFAQSESAPIRITLAAFAGIGPSVGAHAGLPITDGVSAGPVTAPSINTVAADALTVFMFGTSRAANFTMPAGLTEVFDIGNSSDAGAGSLAAGTQVYPSVSTTGTKTATPVDSADTSPFRIGVSLSIIDNRPPNAPTLVSPIGNAAIDRAITQRLSWSFSDPDAVDSQSQGDVRYRPTSPAGAAWTDVLAATTSQFWDAPASTFAAGQYEWQVRTYDAQGLVGPYSASEFFTAATVPAEPTITAPVSGATVTMTSYPVAWSTPSQDAFQVRTVADNLGAADTAVVYTDTGTVESTSTRSRSVAFSVNDRNEHIQVRVRSGGLWSPWASVRVLVSYTPPAVPTLTITTDDAAGSITVAVTNPAPGAGEPTVTSHDIYLRCSAVNPTGDPQWPFTEDGKRAKTELAPGGTWIYYGPAKGVDYEVRAVSIGSNSTTVTGAWTGAATPAPEPVPAGDSYSGY